MTEEKINGSNSRGWRWPNRDTLSILAVVAVQTVTVTWFLAGQNAALNAVIKAVQAGEQTAYRKDDAAREREFQMQVQKNITDKVDELTRRVTILEGQAQVRLTK